MKTTFVLAMAILASAAHAEYRFNGEHPLKLTRNTRNEVVASLCYDNFTRCTGSLSLGSFPEVSLYIQGLIWNRRDVNLGNYEVVLRDSLKIVKDYDLEVKKRERVFNDLVSKNPDAAESLRPYLEQAKGKLGDARAYVDRLTSGKKQVLDVLSEVDETFSDHKIKKFQQISAYNFRDFQWNHCPSFKDQNDCYHSGLQFFLTDVKGNLKYQLMAKAIRSQNTESHFPQILPSGISVALLSSDTKNFGTIHSAQMALPVPMEVSDEHNSECQAIHSSGVLKGTDVSCQVFGANWRYPTLKELQANRSHLTKLLKNLTPHTFLQTSDAKGFVNPGAAHLTVCKPVYYNPSTQKTLNNIPGILRDFTFGKEPSGGASAVCVCSKDC
jgi:hypothetical protein